MRHCLRLVVNTIHDIYPKNTTHSRSTPTRVLSFHSLQKNVTGLTTFRFDSTYFAQIGIFNFESCLDHVATLSLRRPRWNAKARPKTKAAKSTPRPPPPPTRLVEDLSFSQVIMLQTWCVLLATNSRWSILLACELCGCILQIHRVAFSRRGKHV